MVSRFVIWFVCFGVWCWRKVRVCVLLSLMNCVSWGNEFGVGFVLYVVVDVEVEVDGGG